MKDDLRYTPTDAFQTFPLPIRETKICTDAAESYENYRKEIMIASSVGLTQTYNRLHDPLDRKPDITKLRRLHAKMDDAVLRAYGWDDLADLALDSSTDGAAPRFLHQTDEPEFTYQKRYHWPAWFRDNVLDRLLELNRTRAEEESEADIDGKMKPNAVQIEQEGTLI